MQSPHIKQIYGAKDANDTWTSEYIKNNTVVQRVDKTNAINNRFTLTKTPVSASQVELIVNGFVYSNAYFTITTEEGVSTLSITDPSQLNLLSEGVHEIVAKYVAAYPQP